MKRVEALASSSLEREPSRNILSIHSGCSAKAAIAERKYPFPSIPCLIVSGFIARHKDKDLLS